LRILLDKNVPVGVRRFLSNHEVRAVAEMNWPPQLGNSELLEVAEASGFDIIVTSDQNIKCQQNLSGRKLALVVLGSNIWPVVRNHGEVIATKINGAKPGSSDFIEIRSRRSPEAGQQHRGDICERWRLPHSQLTAKRLKVRPKGARTK